ncbi:hypothetical protein B484DRAFT_417318 [Ochromonadaceae sp. CCMP2298]|nr:hypothetical protein B484DRAFT_417318 [Ochromonadaceae sp. CCMP2298]
MSGAAGPEAGAKAGAVKPVAKLAARKGTPANGPAPSGIPGKRGPGARAKEPAAPFDIQNFLDKKLRTGPEITVPAGPVFAREESDANHWGIPVMARYLQDIMELPQYVDAFKRSEITGMTFIGMDENNLGALQLEHQFHALKMASHAATLRQMVLEKASINKPARTIDWNTTHVAAHLFYEHSCPDTAVAVLRRGVSGYALQHSRSRDLLKAMGIDGPETENALRALDALIAAVAKDARKEGKEGKEGKEKDPAVQGQLGLLAALVGEEEAEGKRNAAKGKLKGKQSTAIKRRRMKADDVDNEENEDMGNMGPEELAGQVEGLLSELGDFGEFGELDSGAYGDCDVPGDPSDDEIAHSVAYDAAMSSILIGVSHVSGIEPKVQGKQGGDQEYKENENDEDDDLDQREGMYTTQGTQWTGGLELHVIEEASVELDLDGIDKDANAHERGKGGKEGKEVVAFPGDQDARCQVDHIGGKGAGKGNGKGKSKPLRSDDDDSYNADDRDKRDSEPIDLGALSQPSQRKMGALGRALAFQAQSVELMRQRSDKLEREALAMRHQQQRLLRQSSDSSRLIQALIDDRNGAVQELQQVVRALDQQAQAQVKHDRERANTNAQLVRQLDETARKEGLSITPLLGSLGDSLGNSLGTLASLALFRGVPASAASAATAASASGELPLPLPVGLEGRPLAATAPASSTRRRRDRGARGDGLRDGDSSGSDLDEPERLAQTQPQHQAQVTQAQVGRTSPAKPPGMSSVAPSLDLGNANPIALANKLLGDGPSPQSDIVGMMAKTADEQSLLWSRIMHRYRLPRTSAADRLSDSTLLLRSIAGRWLRLGHQMLRDAEAPETPPEERRILRGLRRTAANAMEGRKDRPKHTGGVMGGSGTLTGTPSVGTPTEDHGSNRYYLAAGVVMVLALAQRVINRLSEGKDKAQLLHLLNKIVHGELPLTELSRDNMRDFLDAYLGLDLKWDKFDSVCQRLDPDRNGFISTPAVVHAFERLTPLVEQLAAPVAQYMGLTLLSVCANTLAQGGTSVLEALGSLLHSSKTPSFTKFLVKEAERIEEQRLFDPDNVQISPRTLRQAGDARVVERQHFAADILFELSREFVSRGAGGGEVDSKLLPNSSKTRLRESGVQYVLCRRDSQYLSQNHREVCNAVARGLQVYEGPAQALPAHLGTLFLTLLKFRRACLVRALETPPASPSPSHAPSHAPSLSHAPSSHSSPLSSLQIREALQNIESRILVLTGVAHTQEAGAGVRARARAGTDGTEIFPALRDTVSVGQYEFTLAELLGIHLPQTGNLHLHLGLTGVGAGTGAGEDLCGLAEAQLAVEANLHITDAHFALLSLLQVPNPAVGEVLASSQGLKDLQSELFQQLWRDGGLGKGDMEEKENADTGGRGSLGALQERLEGPLPHVVEEVNQLMHSQRVQQAGQYLALLNAKATRRRKAIRSLMNLWHSAKLVISKTQPMKDDLARLHAMPAEEILFQTRQVQQMLVDEMQVPIDTKTAQLASRVRLLQRRMDVIPDEDAALGALLREVGVLENALLQANTDGMRLASRIVQQLAVKRNPLGSPTSPEHSNPLANRTDIFE